MYLRHKIEVLLWNYRGYGFTPGTPNFTNIKVDAECMVEYIRKLNRWNKIAVHGISMGGLAACYLGS